MAHPAKQTEALLWLLDHAGRYVTVSIELDVGSHSEPVVSQQGILEHWTDDRPGELTDAIIAATGTGLSGWYKVEKLSLDLTRVDNAVASFEIKSGVVKNAPLAALAAAHGESQPGTCSKRVEVAVGRCVAGRWQVDQRCGGVGWCLTRGGGSVWVRVTRFGAAVSVAG
jgi:hypothetical protein